MARVYDKDLAIELYKQGVQYRDIAKTVGAGLSTIYQLISSRDLPKRREKNVPAEEIIAFHNQGFSPEQIREMTGASIDRISILTADISGLDDDLQGLTYAKKKTCINEKVVVGNKVYIDVTDEWM